MNTAIVASSSNLSFPAFDPSNSDKTTDVVSTILGRCRINAIRNNTTIQFHALFNREKIAVFQIPLVRLQNGEIQKEDLYRRYGHVQDQTSLPDKDVRLLLENSPLEAKNLKHLALSTYIFFLSSMKTTERYNPTSIRGIPLSFLAQYPNLTSISLAHFQAITTKTIDELAFYCPQLTHIDMEYSIREYQSGNIYDALSRNYPNLQEINLCDHNHLDDEDLAFFHRCKALTKINLSKHHNSMCIRRITDEGLRNFAMQHPQLTEIDLSNCWKFGDQGIQHLAEFCPNLESVDLCSTKISDAAIHALAKRGNLTSINLNNTGITTDAIVALAKQNPKLRSINLGYCSQLQDGALEALAQHCPELQMIELCNTQFSLHGLKNLVTRCTKLNYIGLKNCYHIDDALLKHIGLHARNLTLIDLVNLHLITKTALQQLKRDLPSIEMLNYSNHEILVPASLRDVEIDFQYYSIDLYKLRMQNKL